MPPDAASELFQFFGGYFHQDCFVDDATADEVISRYCQEHDAGAMWHLAFAIDSYAATFTSDAALEEALFRELSCYYMPSADGLTVRAWLEHVASSLRATAR